MELTPAPRTPRRLSLPYACCTLLENVGFLRSLTTNLRRTRLLPLAPPPRRAFPAPCLAGTASTAQIYASWPREKPRLQNVEETPPSAPMLPSRRLLSQMSLLLWLVFSREAAAATPSFTAIQTQSKVTTSYGRRDALRAASASRLPSCRSLAPLPPSL